jgi:hypothetical protein
MYQGIIQVFELDINIDDISYYYGEYHLDGDVKELIENIDDLGTGKYKITVEKIDDKQTN